ncbi:RNA-directed DNA polymerase, eukaryota, reverse transcriptase zinc-binding domain protein [Tanacetum coccineum]
MGNNSFIRKFCNSTAHFLPHQSSDHCPAVLIMPKTLLKKKRAFKFANFIADKPEFTGLVDKEWNIEVKGCEMYKVVKKLKAMKYHMKNLTLKTEEALTLKENNNAMKEEEKLHKNMIDLVCDEKGNTFEGLEVAEQEDATLMVRQVTNKEIKEALFDICDNKAPGPDRFTSKIYKEAWSTVGRDVCMNDHGTYKNGLCKIVSNTQSAFIPDRKITYNILLTQELLRGYTWKNYPQRVAMKIDIQKAYDTVNWDFLECILKEFDFPQKMINWIMVCVRTVAFSIYVNGERHGYFKGGRGLSSFKYHWGCKELEISHICFADDLLVLCHGDVKSVEVVKSALEYFSSISVLLPNLGKSTVFFGNVDDSTKDEILKLLPFKIGKLLVSYLGVPLITKQLGVNECKCLIDKVKAKGDLSNGKAKVSWKLVCRPKKEGGLGIKNLSVWNEVLIAKNLWNIACNKESLWVKWINVVRLKGTSIWEVKPNNNTSCGWKHILNLRSKMRSHIKYIIGNGETAMLWHDRWWDGGVLNELFPLDNMAVANTNAKLCEMICNGEWKWPKSWTRIYPQLNCIPVPNLVECEDKVVWNNNDGDYVKLSIKNMWKDWVHTGEKMTRLKRKMYMDDVNNEWENILNRVIEMAYNNSIKSILRRVMLAACVYFIWDERNKRLFGNPKRNHETVLLLIINNIRMKLMSLKVNNSAQVADVNREWQVSMNGSNNSEVLMK